METRGRELWSRSVQSRRNRGDPATGKPHWGAVAVRISGSVGHKAIQNVARGCEPRVYGTAVVTPAKDPISYPRILIKLPLSGPKYLN